VRGLVIAIAITGCRSDEPIERLPAPESHFDVMPPLPPPPPPPPPPKGGEPTDPPAPVRALAHRERCRLTIDGAAQTAARAAELLDHLGKRESWVTGVIGCMTSAPDTIVIDCGGASLAISESCGNVLDATGTQIGTWSPEMQRWFRGYCLCVPKSVR
jgi:hypothetical protein